MRYFQVWDPDDDRLDELAELGWRVHSVALSVVDTEMSVYVLMERKVEDDG